MAWGLDRQKSMQGQDQTRGGLRRRSSRFDDDDGDDSDGSEEDRNRRQSRVGEDHEGLDFGILGLDWNFVLENVVDFRSLFRLKHSINKLTSL